MYQLHHGDSLDVLRTMPDNSIDSVVTDPPYGISFMGKHWDYDVPQPELWREVLRVLKPGGHALVACGTRTQHRVTVAIEDAGFEIRDVVAWVYGSGFPKSHNISKALDKGQGENRDRQLRFTEWMRGTGITSEQINAATNSNMASHYLTDKSQPAIATADMFDRLRPYLPEVPEYIERLVAERTGIEWPAYKNRRVISERVMVQGGGTSLQIRMGERREVNADITEPATDLAQQWDGWGTALKPAMELWTLARKPLVGTVAQNVTEYGTGGLNIDGCRVGERFPANLIHDGSDEVVGLFSDSQRFFYCAKASKAERNKGLEKNHHPTVKPVALMRYLCRMITPPNGTVLDPFMGSGTTGVAAKVEGFDFIGIEREAEYLAISQARIDAEQETLC